MVVPAKALRRRHKVCQVCFLPLRERGGQKRRLLCCQVGRHLEARRSRFARQLELLAQPLVLVPMSGPLLCDDLSAHAHARVEKWNDNSQGGRSASECNGSPAVAPRRRIATGSSLAAVFIHAFIGGQCQVRVLICVPPHVQTRPCNHNLVSLG